MSENSQARFELILYPRNMSISEFRPDASGSIHGSGLEMERPMRRLTSQLVTLQTNDIVAQTAITAWLIRNAGPADGESELDFKKRLDEGPTGVMEDLFDQSPFGRKIVGCEGGKEKRKGGQKEAVHTIKGFHGGLDKELGSVDSAVDPVEGTKFLFGDKLGAKIGSIAIAANSLFRNVPLTPPEFIDPEETIKTDALYMNRAVLGKEFTGAHPEMSLEEILEIGRRNTGIVDLRQIEITILNRERNRALIERAQACGVTLKLIEAGDLVPGLFALKGTDMSVAPEDRRVVMSMGSGGKEEALIAAMAAKAVRGVFWGRYEDDKGRPSEQYPGLKTLNEFLPGEAKDFTVNFASITGVDSQWFNLPPVKLHSNGIREIMVPVIDITSNGFTTSLRSYRA